MGIRKGQEVHMGLDVYLYKCPDRRAAFALEEQYRRETERLWAERGGDQKEWKDEDWERYFEDCARLAGRLGLDDYGRHPANQQVEIPSRKYPDHLFKIGYFRSSYNEGGLDSVLWRAGLPTLYDIFCPPDGEHRFVPDWVACLGRARGAVERLRDYASRPEARYEVLVVCCRNALGEDPNRQRPAEPRAALRLFSEMLREARPTGIDEFGDYYGEYFLGEPLRVAGAIRGTYFSIPCVYLVYEHPGRWERCIQALEIVCETVEYVLSQPDRDDYYLWWSA
jgi:hypothetical protein